LNIGTYIFTDNNIFEKDIDYTLKTLCKTLNKKLHIRDDVCNPNWKKDKAYINVGIDSAKTIQEHFAKEKNIFCIIGKLEFNLSEKNIYYHLLDFALSSWGKFSVNLLKGAFVIKWAELFQHELNQIQRCSRLFNATKMILFNDNAHEDICEQLIAGRISIDEALQDKRWLIARTFGDAAVEPDDDQWSNKLIYHAQWENKDAFDAELWKKEFV